MKKLISYAEIAKDFVQAGVDNAVTTVEEIHLSVADAAFEMLAGRQQNSEQLAEAKERHRDAAKAVYETVRTVNRKVGELATEGFEMLENSQIAAKVRSKS